MVMVGMKAPHFVTAHLRYKPLVSGKAMDRTDEGTCGCALTIPYTILVHSHNQTLTSRILRLTLLLLLITYHSLTDVLCLPDPSGLCGAGRYKGTVLLPLYLRCLRWGDMLDAFAEENACQWH